MDIDRISQHATQQGIEEVGILITDVPGQLQRKNYAVRPIEIDGRQRQIAERLGDIFTEGTTFDSSSLRGMNDISKSDMTVRPDPDSIIARDPHAQLPTLLAFGDVFEPAFRGGGAYARDPRGAAKRAAAYLRGRGIGDEVRVAPEIEFFVADEAVVRVGPYEQELRLRSREAADSGNLYAIQAKRGYFPDGVADTVSDLRAQVLKELEGMGIPCEAHHHEVASLGQCEVNMRHAELVRMADQSQLYKRIVRAVAQQRGKVAIFLPKPIGTDNGSGMHVNLSVSKDGRNLFANPTDPLGLSQEARYAIGGILAHIGALSALANPTTSSSRRFAPGFEAPVHAVWSPANRSAAIRVPVYSTDVRTRRIEARFPDPTANPYLLYAGLAMAMINGIENRITPPEPIWDDAYAHGDGFARIPRHLDDRLEALARDRGFLLTGGVFTTELLDAYVAVVTETAAEVERTPSPMEILAYGGRWN